MKGGIAMHRCRHDDDNNVTRLWKDYLQFGPLSDEDLARKLMEGSDQQLMALKQRADTIATDNERVQGIAPLTKAWWLALAK